MNWNISAEVVSAIMMCIILMYARRGSMLPTFKNRAFQYCLMITFVSVLTNICSTLMLEQYLIVPYAVNAVMLIIYLYLQNKQMFTDSLTGVLNRQEFNKMLEIKGRSQQRFTVIVISLKDFKFINDTFSQQYGDALLIQLSQALRMICKQAVYRYGGDEFAMIFDDDAVCQAVIQHIKQRMKEPWSIQSMELLLGYAIGGITNPDVTSSLKHMIKGLEYAIAKAKTEEHSGVCFCTNAMIEDLERSTQIVSALKQGIREESFRVFFQPIYDVEHQAYTRAEALLRMPLGPMQHITPDEFIPLAEENGLITQITYQVLEQTCRFIQEVKTRHQLFYGVSVNVSIISFMQEDLSDQIISTIERNQVPFDQIKIEITESMLANNFTLITEAVQSMRQRGMQFLLDDFGTGYSNISYVLSIPFDIVKIDKSLVWMSMQDQQAAVVVKKIIEAFLAIGCNVLAEGVETKEQLDFVTACGCN